MIRTQTKIRARYAETDKMGFIHHQNYVAYFELARVDMMRQMGVSYRELEKDDYFLPVLDLGVKYHQSNTFDDELVIHSILEEIPKVKIKIKYEIFRGDVLTTSGFSLHGFINSEGRPCRPPESFVKTCKQHFQNIE